MIAAQMRGLADSILIPVNTLTRLPPGTTQAFVEGTTTGAVAAAQAPKGRKASAYSRAYKKAFKRQAMKYKKKNGQWKKDGFKRAVKEAHRVARGGKK